MLPGDLVTVAPDWEDVPDELWPMLDPLYCCAAQLVELDDENATIEWLRDGKRYQVPSQFVQPLRNELFPSKIGRSRAVVYLDQCVASELIKNSRGELRGKNAEAAQRLMAALDEAVFARETAICIESVSHRIESTGLASGRAGGIERLEEVWRFLKLRSRGLSLKDREEALHFQVHQLAGLRTGGHVFRPEHLWELGLDRDPDKSNEDTGVLGGAFVVAIPWTKLESGPRIAAQLESERQAGDFSDFNTERRGFIKLLRDNARANLVHRWCLGSKTEDDRKAIRAVMDGPDFEQLPYVDIKSTLVASLLSERQRKFRDSDPADLEFTALALAFSHLMMVDGNLYNRIRSCRLDVKYQTKVLSAGLASYEAAADWLAKWGAETSDPPTRAPNDEG